MAFVPDRDVEGPSKPPGMEKVGDPEVVRITVVPACGSYSQLFHGPGRLRFHLCQDSPAGFPSPGSSARSRWGVIFVGE